MTEHLWYAAFGSNLSRARFDKYLSGGSAELASSTPEPGARDPSAPIAEDVITVDREVFFAWSADKWDGGGVAFLSLERSNVSTICRLYKITVEQFEDVHMQENRAAAPEPLNLDELVGKGSLVQHDGLYGLALLLDIHADGCPVVTLTTQRTDLELNSPSAGYAATIASGLIECASLSPKEAIDYVRSRRGVDEQFDHEELEALVSRRK